jgi:hypothetical protein
MGAPADQAIAVIGKQGLVVAMLFALLAGGLACIGIALRWKWRTLRRARNGCVVDGRVVDLEVVGGSPDEPDFMTWVQFRDGRGQVHRIQSSWASSPAPYKLGETVRVSYEADDPAGAEIVQKNQSIVMVGVLGLTLALIATLLLFGILVQGVTVE